jgi:NAD(P)-dependent dehydrogenase (short-subunit alcohol dehydrogenase family)
MKKDVLQKLFNLQGKAAILTGGMGQLGTAFTKALLNCGARVAVFDQNISQAKLKFSPNAGLSIQKVDIRNKQDIKAGLKKVIKKWGMPQILINNAGIDAPPGASAKENCTLENYKEASWDKVMDVNLKGMFLCSQTIGGAMAKNRHGSIINISSVYGNLSPDQRIYRYRKDKFLKPVAYCVSKSGVLNLTRYLATYWAASGVRVNTLTLGGVYNRQDKQFVREYAKRTPLGRMASENEYNGAILFLASDASSYMTGSNLIIDGGWTSW